MLVHRKLLFTYLKKLLTHTLNLEYSLSMKEERECGIYLIDLC
jgi:hypothetical protein